LQKGRTATQLAAFHGSERCLRRMLHAGAQPDSKDEVRQQASLHCFQCDLPMLPHASRNSICAVELPLGLISYFPVFRAHYLQVLQIGLTALHKACVTGQLACIRVLLEYNADPRVSTSDGLTAMHLAAWKGQRDAIRLLATRNVPVNETARDGSTPLHEAVRSGDDSTVALLLQLGADPYVEDKVLSRCHSTL
jgi:ankyrin repeat protein